MEYLTEVTLTGPESWLNTPAAFIASRDVECDINAVTPESKFINNETNSIRYMHLFIKDDFIL